MCSEKKVLFICKGHQNIAGAQLYLKQVTGVFPPENYDLHYAFYHKDGTRVFDEIARERPISKWQYDWRHLSFMESFRQARNLLDNVRPDFLIFNSNEDEIIPALFAARLSGIKNKIMVVHWALDGNSLPLMVRKKKLPFSIPSRYAARTRLKRFFAYLFLDKLIFVNNQTRRAFIKLYRVNPKKCRTIYNGIDVERFSLDEKVRQMVRAKLGVRDDEFMILATGNLSPVKGHEVLIKAVARLVRRGMNVKCFIAGQGELEGKLNALIVEKRISEQCCLLGFRDDIPQLLSAADIFCMPSLNEALGYSILEAMAAGKAVIASRVGGIPEVVTHLRDGVLLQAGNPDKLADIISQLIKDEKFRNEIAATAIKKVRSKFSRQTMRKHTGDFLQV